MSTYENLVVEARTNGVWIVRIDRPQVMNAIDDATVLEFAELFEALRRDASCRAMVLASGEKAFCTGSDLDEAHAATPALHLYHWEIGQRMLAELSALPFPVIAAIEGYALGGGAEIALACDLRVMSLEGKIGFPEVTIGAIPSWGGTQRLPRVVGQGHAIELLATGTFISGERAFQIGLVNAAVPAGKTLAQAVEYAERLASLPPRAMEAAKSLVNSAYEVPLKAGEELERHWNLRCVAEPDFSDRVQSYLNKRAGS